jgi:phosphoribosyl 1,2-cyclic phosphodiesterase
MGLYFKSIRSGSSGNCLLLWTSRTSVLIDCGVPSRSKCEQLLEEHAGGPDRIKAVVVSHPHRDHICAPSLAVLAKHGIPIRCHETCVDAIHDLNGHGPRPPKVRAFSDRPFRVGDFIFRPISIPHQPTHPNFAFIIYCRQQGIRRKVVIMTDFYDWKGLVEKCIDSDFIFVESNHDPQLLKKNPNYNSRFHMKNEKTAWLLYHIRRQSTCKPKAVMLGHLSAMRNSKQHALETLEAVFRKNGVPCDFSLYIADRDAASPVVEI